MSNKYFIVFRRCHYHRRLLKVVCFLSGRHALFLWGLLVLYLYRPRYRSAGGLLVQTVSYFCAFSCLQHVLSDITRDLVLVG